MSSPIVEELFTQIENESDIFAKAKLLFRLQKDEDVPAHLIARRLNIKPSYLSHILRLNRLPEIIVDGYYTKLISISHLFILSRLKDQDKLLAVYEKILAENLTAGQTDNLIREELYNIKPHGNYLTESERKTFIEALQTDNNVTAKIVQTRIKSKIIIEIKGNPKTTNPILQSLLGKIVSRSELK